MNKPFYVYFVPKTHHDLGYTHTIDKLLLAYCQYYDDVLDFCDRTANYPSESQYRYTVESFWSLDYYLKNTTEENRSRMEKYVRSKRIEIQAFYANVIDGICSEEEIARLMYPSMAYAKKCGVNVTSAALTDIPGMSAGIIKALAAANVPYLFAGFPTYFEWGDAAGHPLPQTKSFWAEDQLFPWGHPAAFHWKVPTGDKVFAWYQYGYGYMGKDIEPLLEAEVYEEVERCLPEYVASLKKKGVPYSVMRYVDHGMDNAPPAMSVCDVVKKWNECHEDIKCVVATESMFFDALYKDCSDKLIPEVFGEMPHTDYTTCAFSEAQMTTLNARTKEQMQILERFNALSQINGNRSNIADHMNSMYADVILYDEHCFGMAGYGFVNDYNRSIKMNYAFSAAWKTEKLWKEVIVKALEQERNAYTLFCGAGIKGAAIASVVEAETFNAEQPCGVYYLRDDNDKIVSIQVDKIDDSFLPIPGLREKYALKAPNATLLQYTIFVPEAECISLSNLRYEGKCEAQEKEVHNASILENCYYKIEFSSQKDGAYRIFDKDLGKYITDEAYPFGGIVVRDIEANKMHMPRVDKLYHRMSGEVADSIVLCTSVYSIPLIVTEITLYHTTKRIDFAYRLVLDQTPLREAFALFPFLVDNPHFTYQGIGMPLKAFDDMVEGSNTNQYACQHWCKVEGTDYACVLAMSEARIMEFGGIQTTAVSQAHRQLSPAGFADPYVQRKDIHNGHIASILTYNNCRTNFAPTQQGEVIYRYAVTSGKKVDAESFAENFVYPPMLKRGTIPGEKVSVGPENLRITCLKAAENGDGYIVRIEETAGKNTKVAMNFSAHEIVSVTQCSISEEDICQIPMDRLSVNAYQTATFRVRFS